jgi:outer membrane protein
MKRNCLLPVVIIILILFACNSAFGQGPDKIGVVDLQRCLDESNEGKKAFKILKDKKDALQKQLDGKQKELVELGKELEKQSMMLSMDAQEDRKRVIERKTRELEYFFKDLNEEMKKAQDKEQERIFEELAHIIAHIGSEENYTLIIEDRAGAVLYRKNTINITDKVIKAYDQTKEKK